MSVHPLIKSLKASLIVSVQAYPGEPLRTPETMAQMSRACELGGRSGYPLSGAFRYCCHQRPCRGASHRPVEGRA